jgi:hypothetical protein
MKTITYRGYVINKTYLGTYTAMTGRYGIVEERTIGAIKKLIDNSISL